MKWVNPYKMMQDERGRFLGITNSGPWNEINMLESRAGAVRGGHYHKHTTEAFYIICGKIEIEIRNLDNNTIEVFSAKQDDVFIIEPMEIHTFKILTDSKWINMLSSSMDQTNGPIDIFSA